MRKFNYLITTPSGRTVKQEASTFKVAVEKILGSRTRKDIKSGFTIETVSPTQEDIISRVTGSRFHVERKEEIHDSSIKI
jgi:hypothetical protein